MDFKFAHNNINVLELQRSMDFYSAALGLTEIKRKTAEDGGFILVYLGDGQSEHNLELTWIKERTSPYDLGDNEMHIAFTTTDFDTAYKRHKEMDCVCYENPKMGIYFINDPDGYWLEILPKR